MEYIDNWLLGLYVKILVKTVIEVFLVMGADAVNKKVLYEIVRPESVLLMFLPTLRRKIIHKCTGGNNSE